MAGYIEGLPAGTDAKEMLKGLHGGITGQAEQIQAQTEGVSQRNHQGGEATAWDVPELGLIVDLSTSQSGPHHQKLKISGRIDDEGQPVPILAAWSRKLIGNALAPSGIQAWVGGEFAEYEEQEGPGFSIIRHSDSSLMVNSEWTEVPPIPNTASVRSAPSETRNALNAVGEAVETRQTGVEMVLAGVYTVAEMLKELNMLESMQTAQA